MSERDPTRARRDEDGERTDRAGEDDDEAKVTSSPRSSGTVARCCCCAEATSSAPTRASGVASPVSPKGAPTGRSASRFARRPVSPTTGSLVRSGRPIRFTDDDLEPSREWVVHPYLFDLTADSREIELGEEHDEFAWTDPTEIVAGDAEAGVRATAADSKPLYVPPPETLATTSRRCRSSGRPTSASHRRFDRSPPTTTTGLRSSRSAHSRYFAIGRDCSSPSGRRSARNRTRWDELAELATRLLEARPAMAVLRNRVNRAMATAAGIDATDAAGSNSDGSDDGTDGSSRRDATAVLETTRGAIDRAIAADADAAATAGEHIEDGSRRFRARERCSRPSVRVTHTGVRRGIAAGTRGRRRRRDAGGRYGGRLFGDGPRRRGRRVRPRHRVDRSRRRRRGYDPARRFGREQDWDASARDRRHAKAFP